jgi:hypothetical protein
MMPAELRRGSRLILLYFGGKAHSSINRVTLSQRKQFNGSGSIQAGDSAWRRGGGHNCVTGSSRE